MSNYRAAGICVWNGLFGRAVPRERERIAPNACAIPREARHFGAAYFTSSRTSAFLGLISSTGNFAGCSTLSQYHFLPGKYLVALCFNIDGGNGSRVYCRDNLTVPLDIQPGSKLQLSLDFPDRGRWTALQQPPSEAARAKLVADFESIMAANKKPVASAK